MKEHARSSYRDYIEAGGNPNTTRGFTEWLKEKREISREDEQSGDEIHEVSAKSYIDANREIDRLTVENLRCWETLHAIAVKGLGLPDPWAVVGEDIPAEWQHGTLSDKVADLRRKLADAKAALEDIKTESINAYSGYEDLCVSHKVVLIYASKALAQISESSAP